MFLKKSNLAVDGVFDEKEYENIFLHNRYPGEKKKSSSATKDDKAELWILFKEEPRYDGLDILRKLRELRGIHTNLKIGPRSAKNQSLRGFVCDNAGLQIWFEGYRGNIGEATQTIIAMAPYTQNEKNSALSQKVFLRMVVPLRGRTPLQKIDALMAAYATALFVDGTSFLGLIDADQFLFIPPAHLRSGVGQYFGSQQMLNTHLLYGFNFFQRESQTTYFSHGLSRFGLPDFVRVKESDSMAGEDYTEALRGIHTLFLTYLTKGRRTAMARLREYRAAKSLPQQVAAMVAKKIFSI